MDRSWTGWLERWSEAGLIDSETGARIRTFEAQHAGSTRLRWPILIAVAFGGIMIAGGILLFVAANWDVLSPGARFALVLTLVASFHLAGAATAGRFSQMSHTLHALGTIALGAGIALAGQIFNLQEHWPGGVMLWALGAGLAWFLLRHTAQLTLFAIFAPAWLVSEWIAATETRLPSWWAAGVIPAAGIFLLGMAYFTSCGDQRPRGERRALLWLGAIALVIDGGVLADVMSESILALQAGSMRLLVLGVAAAFVGPLLVSWGLRRANLLAQGLATLWVIVLCFVIPSTPGVAAYGWWAIGSLGLVGWGVHDAREERINLGAAFFAATVFAFYFSEVMDKLGRSASLVGLGLLFLGGGWALERMRRRLIDSAREAR